MSLLSPTIDRVRCHADEDNMLQDLQLAAELGKTLLERNKELENTVKLSQCTIEEQAQEIEYMKKQTAALREVNDSRLKIYEQLEISIQDLERANHRLIVENTNDKKVIKSQAANIENLEAKCEDLQKKLEELSAQHEDLLRHQSSNTASQQSQQDGRTQEGTACNEVEMMESKWEQLAVRLDQFGELDNDEEVKELRQQLHDSKNNRIRDQKRITELGELLANLVQENSALEEQLNIWRSKAQDIKNLQEEINTLEEVKQGNICARCLRGMDSSKPFDEMSIIFNQEEDDMNLVDSYISENCRETDISIQDSNNRSILSEESGGNIYRDLVEKYEALLEVQKQPSNRRKNSVPTTGMSLQEELEMSGEFNSFNSHSIVEENESHPTPKVEISKTEENSRNKVENMTKKPLSGTPTDFSEAETLSSGFLDETSNKATQTDGRPGFLLCSIADGDDCKLSIYDDNSTLESRFKKTPEYRQLFSEIFEVLKRAADAKDDGEKWPLLDEKKSSHEGQTDVNQSQTKEDDETDDSQSVLSSVVSSVMSEPVLRVHTQVEKKMDSKDHLQENNRPDEPTLRPLNNRRQHLDFFSAQLKKKKGSARKNSRRLSNERSTPDVTPTTNPKFLPPKSNSSGKKKFRPLTSAELGVGVVGNGIALPHLFSNKTRESPRRHANCFIHTNSQQYHSSPDYKEYKPSSASEDVARLKRIEMSYAEVLRMPNKTKGSNGPRRH